MEFKNASVSEILKTPCTEGIHREREENQD